MREEIPEADDCQGKESSSEEEPLLYQVEPTDACQRLDLFLASRIQGLSRSRIKSLVDDGCVLVDGKTSKAAYSLRAGQTIAVTLPPVKETELVPQNLPLTVLHEDSSILVVSKAPGMVVHPGAGVPSGTLVNAVLFHCPDLPGIGGEMRPGIVHRLDKDTSGCMVVAKTEEALANLQRQFQEHTAEKFYLALVHGIPDASGRLETLHGRHPTDRLRFTSHVTRGRTAITEWTVLESYGASALVSVHLLTGRTHQIRMHFSESGHPLLADLLYGGVKKEKHLAPSNPTARAATAIGRQALHAHRLLLNHPVTGERMEFQAPIPHDFQAAEDILRASVAGA